MNYVYLHGFSSSPASLKGQTMKQAFAERGIELQMPDLNQPSFEKLRIRAAMEHLDALIESIDSQGPWSLIGSSLGGYMAALWAERNPERVHRLFLLCPGFELLERWPEIMGRDHYALWEEQGYLPVPDATGVHRRLHWDFIEDARTLPGTPETTCPTWIAHGTRDEVVPIELSRSYAASREHVTLEELDDDHRMLDSQERLRDAALAWFELESAPA